MRRLARPVAHRPAVHPNRKVLGVVVADDNCGRLAPSEVPNVPIADVGFEEHLGERLGHSRHLVASIGPVDIRLVSGRDLGVGDRDHGLGRRGTATDDACRLPNERLWIGQSPGDSVRVARNIEPSRNTPANADHDMTSEQRKLALRAMIPGRDLPSSVLESGQTGELHAEPIGHLEAGVEGLPLSTHLVLVNRFERQARDALPALRERHAIAATERRQDELLFRVVANSAHEVVEVDDENVQTELPRSECCRGASRATADHEHVEEMGGIEGGSSLSHSRCFS